LLALDFEGTDAQILGNALLRNVGSLANAEFFSNFAGCDFRFIQPLLAGNLAGFEVASFGWVLAMPGGLLSCAAEFDFAPPPINLKLLGILTVVEEFAPLPEVFENNRSFSLRAAGVTPSTLIP
jgi:hypothetical protein